MILHVWDTETYPNFFLYVGKFRGDDRKFIFEISSRKNQKNELLSHLSYLSNMTISTPAGNKQNCYMVGYNSLNFDYPITHELLTNHFMFDSKKAYDMAQTIITSQEYGFTQIRQKDRIIPQIDLAKINHFDNKNRRTSLKSLQVAMRSESVEDLPITPGTYLSEAQMDQLIYYCIHDVTETEKFLEKNMNNINMRVELMETGAVSGDVLNFSDVKIGYQYLIEQVGRSKCFISGSTPRQTNHAAVHFKDIILPKIYFRNDKYNEILDWFRSLIIYPKSEEGFHLEKQIENLTFVFGGGGIHASVENKKYVSDDRFDIVDIDVKAMYPSIFIANGFYPEHLGQNFTVPYAELKTKRSLYPKKSAMDKLLKLAMNGGGFGKTNDPYSCFYDLACFYKITINGQLQLLQLVESIFSIPGVEIIQANTDGVTAKVPKGSRDFFNMAVGAWEKDTGLELEHDEFKKLFIRDVNNYIAVTKKGKIKRKGAYWFPESDEDYEGVWNKDFSFMVVPKAVEKVLIDDWDPRFAAALFTDPFDFMIRYKTTGAAKVYIGEKEMLKTVRYYVSKNGQPMKKIYPPKGVIGEFCRKNSLQDSFYNKIKAEVGDKWDERIHTKNKSTYQMKESSIEDGWLVSECNVAKMFDWKSLNYDYYINEINKLIIK